MKTRKGKIIVCSICKREFYVSPCKIDRSKYCSKSCQSIGKKKLISCIVCNKKVYKFPSQSMAKFCSQICQGKAKSIRQTGKNNPYWRGDKVTYKGLHQWINKNMPKKTYCEMCGEKKELEASNKSGNYLRDFSDWQWLCRKCHAVYDKKSEKFSGKNNPRWGKHWSEEQKELRRKWSIAYWNLKRKDLLKKLGGGEPYEISA